MPPPTNLGLRALLKTRLLLALLASLLATFWTRLIVMAVAVAVLLFLLYANVWFSFSQEAELPAGITPTNPELDISLLNAINDQRTARVQHTRPDFRTHSNLFVPLSPSR